MGRPDSRRRRARSRTPALAPLPPSSTRRTRPARQVAWDAASVLRVVLAAACVLVAASYVVGLVPDVAAGIAGLTVLALHGLVSTGLLWRDRQAEAKPAPAPRWRTGPTVAAVAAAVVVAGLVAAVREDPQPDDLVGPPALVVPLMLLALAVGAWMVGVLLAMVVALPAFLVATGLWGMAHGRPGGIQVLGGLWIFSIFAYPGCLSFAGDGPRRSLGFLPLLGIESRAWVITDPGWLWPARAFAAYVWLPVVAVLAYAVLGRLVRRLVGRPSP